MRHLLLALAVPSLMAQQSAMPVVGLDQVLEGYYGTLGGLAKIRATKTRRVEGHFEGLATPVTYVQTNERPNHYWLVTLNGPERRLKVFDGKEGWEVLAVGPRRRLLPGEVSELDADFDGPLVDAKAKGHQVDFQGAVPFGYGRAYKVKVAMAGGETRTLWFEAQSFHLVKQLSRRPAMNSNWVETELLFSDFREVEGRSVPFKVGVATPGSAPRFSVVVDSMKFDAPVDVPAIGPASK